MSKDNKDQKSLINSRVNIYIKSPIKATELIVTHLTVLKNKKDKHIQ